MQTIFTGEILCRKNKNVNLFSKKKKRQSAFVMLVDEKDGYLGSAIAVTAKVAIKPAIIASLGMYITRNY